LRTLKQLFNIMIDALRTLIKQFMPFAQKKMGFSRPPRLFLRQDSANASNPLGKTGFYDPENESITLYITERHPKDILRSLSHELMHHTQKCNGDFDGIENMGEQGYAQNNPQMRAMEIKAYQAAVYFRDFEDSLRETIYYEHLQKGEKDKMSTKDWKNRELNMLLNEAWGFKFNTLQEFDEFSGTGEVQEEAQEEEIEEAARGSQLGADRAKKHCGSGQKLAGGICVDLKETCPPGEEEEEGKGKFSGDPEMAEAKLDEEHVDERRGRGRADPRNQRGAADNRQRPLEEEEIEEIAGVGGGAADPRRRRKPHGTGRRVEDEPEKKEEEEEERKVAESQLSKDTIREVLRDVLISLKK